jgi:hypothetical protein
MTTLLNGNEVEDEDDDAGYGGIVNPEEDTFSHFAADDDPEAIAMAQAEQMELEEVTSSSG